EYSIFVTDSTTGATRVYSSVEGEFRSFADDSAFGPPTETGSASATAEGTVETAGGVETREDGSRPFARLPAGTGPELGLLPAVLPATQNVLWNQTDQVADIVISSENRVDAGASALSTEAADDFVVPGNKVWMLQGVDVAGAYYGPGALGPAQSVNVFVYLDSNGFPGNLQCSQRNLRPTSGLGNGAFVVNLPSACRLTAGRYWVSVQSNQNFQTAGQWGWGVRLTVREKGAVWRNSGNGYGTGCSNWNRLGGC